MDVEDVLKDSKVACQGYLSGVLYNTLGDSLHKVKIVEALKLIAESNPTITVKELVEYL